MSDVSYTYGYYADLNLLRARFALLANGVVCPAFGTACELGFGQGISANIHAAATDTQWYGTDFNPSQAGAAQEMARISGASAKLYDDAFAEFCLRDDLPDFDVIAMHGIWSWISDDNRHVIVDFIRRKLKVGGILYISYNTLPGWASFAPVRHLLKEHANVLGAAGQGILGRVSGALDFADHLLATKPQFLRANPSVADRLKKVTEQNRQYVTHEYFNRDWQPMYFSTMAEWLTPAKLDYACAAHYLDQLDVINFTAEQQRFIDSIPDHMFRQTVRDFMVNRQFRKDFWIKGRRTITADESFEAIRPLGVILTTPRADVPMTMTGTLGNAQLNANVYAPLLDALGKHDVKSMGDLEDMLRASNINFRQLLQSVLVLMANGHLSPAQDAASAERARMHTDNLNRCLIRKARIDGDVAFLASPVSGGGIQVSRFEQLFLDAMQQGKTQPSEWVAFVWSVLQGQAQKIVKDGKTLETAQDNIAELDALARDFVSKKLPILKALGIA